MTKPRPETIELERHKPKVGYAIVSFRSEINGAVPHAVDFGNLEAAAK